MSRNRIIYNVQDLLVGPYTYNNIDILSYTQILQRLLRVKSVSYGVSMPRVDVEELGNRFIAADPIFLPPDVTINFSYTAYNVANEMRFGLNPNYNYNGSAYNSDNESVAFISGVLHNVREHGKRNLYLVISNQETDVHISGNAAIFSDPAGGDLINLLTDPISPNYNLVCFNSAYISQYSFNASVGAPCVCNLGFTSDNISYFSSGSGVRFPNLDVQNRVVVPSPTTTLVIPKYYGDSQPTALLPGDITATITAPQYGPNTANITDWGTNLSDIKIQSYDLNISFSRKNVGSLGYKSYIDRPVNATVFAEASFNAVIGDSNTTGNLYHLMNLDAPYNISIKVKDPRNRSNIALQHDFKGAKIMSINDQGAIGQNNQVSFNFRTAMGLENLTTGFFMSGICDYLSVQTPVSDINGDLITDEGGDVITAEVLAILPNMF